MKRLLNNSDDWNTIVGNFGTIQTFMNGSAAAITDLQTRMTATESRPDNTTALETRIGIVETTVTAHGGKLTNLEARFTTGRAASLAPISTTPSGGVIDLIGVQVATGAAITNLVAFCVALRDSHNALIARSKSWGWMAT